MKLPDDYKNMKYSSDPLFDAVIDFVIGQVNK